MFPFNSTLPLLKSCPHIKLYPAPSEMMSTHHRVLGVYIHLKLAFHLSNPKLLYLKLSEMSTNVTLRYTFCCYVYLCNTTLPLLKLFLPI